MTQEFEYPEIEGYGNRFYARALYDLAGTVAPELLIVELGTYKGQGAASLGQSGRTVITVDHYEGEPLGSGGNALAHYDHVAGTYLKAAAVNLKKYPNVYAVVANTTDSPASTIGPTLYRPETVGMLYHDAAHDADSVEADLRTWMPELAPGGFVVLDDWLSHPGVKAGARGILAELGFAFDELIVDRLAVWRKKEKPS